MGIKELYLDYLLQLQQIYSPGEALVITDRAFDAIANIRHAELIKDPAKQLNNKTTRQLFDAFVQLIEHKPIQYVIAEAWFYHLKFKVNESVLIPRPETEELAELLIRDCRSFKRALSIVDIGTGSGCIAVAIKKNIPGAIVSAIDISENALKVASENAREHRTEVELIQLDFLDESTWDRLPQYHFIISNPPYVPTKEKEKLAKNVVDYEPHLAIFVPDEDPLLFYKKIADFGLLHLNSNGKIYLEVHQDLAKEAKAIFDTSYTHTSIKNDMFGRERMLIVSI